MEVTVEEVVQQKTIEQKKAFVDGLKDEVSSLYHRCMEMQVAFICAVSFTDVKEDGVGESFTTSSAGISEELTQENRMYLAAGLLSGRIGDGAVATMALLASVDSAAGDKGSDEDEVQH